jgi:pimeloyl-ACP methyl ester carboxylesterase
LIKNQLLGHSFGSIITSAYATRFPEKISRLVLLNPIGYPALEGPRWLLTQCAVLYYEIGSALPEKIARKWLSSRIVVNIMSITLAKTKQKPLRKYIHHQHRKYFSRFHDAKTVLASFKTSISYSVKNFASSIKTPTLLIAGELDDITPTPKTKKPRKTIF